MSAIPVIVNGTAGRGWSEEDIRKLEKTFSDAGAEARVFAARSGSEILALAKKALADKPPVLVGGGGDGTISTLASIVHSSATALGVLPLGTLNHFAKDLKIPLEVEEAVRVVVANRQVQVDVGRVNDRTFINNSSLGIYTDIVRDRRRQQQRLGRGKFAALVWASITALRRAPFVRVTLVLDGQERRYRAPFVFIGNNEYIMEGFEIGTRASLREGRLSVYVTRRQSRLGLVALGFRALFGRLRQARDFEATTAQALDIESRHRVLPVATDGEVAVMRTPLHYQSLPGALRVIVP
jgi:YegS/Rv2252/BmrU family lipid kinase